jgi:hypothetical protein
LLSILQNEEVVYNARMQQHVIYGLFDPSDPNEAIRYVGYTSRDPALRLIGHLKEARKRRNHRHHWLNSLVKKGLKPQTVILEIVTVETWQERERFWIAQFSNLVNSTAGGEGLVNPSDEVRKRIGAISAVLRLGNQNLLGHVHTEESRARISAGLRASDKVRAANLLKLGRPRGPQSEETKKKIGDANRGRPRTSEWKLKIAASRTGARLITDGVRRKWLRRKMLKANEPLPSGWSFIKPRQGD